MGLLSLSRLLRIFCLLGLFGILGLWDLLEILGLSVLFGLLGILNLHLSNPMGLLVILVFLVSWSLGLLGR